MDEEQPPKKIRKGAKSCTECRRRKIRCVWTSDEARACRRCEERGSECIPQVFSSGLSRGDGTSSRERISRLERQVSSLTTVVNAIQQKHGEPLVSDTIAGTFTTDGALSDEESEEVDGPDFHPPSYLATLFNNNVLSPGDRAHEARRQGESFSKALLSKARGNLQKLIPTKRDVEIIASFASAWLSLYQTLFPTHAVAQTEEDIVSQYDAMIRPDVDPTSLATWLVTVTITVQQVPPEKINSLSGIKNTSQYGRAVSEAVETSIIAHDSLMGTMGGIHTALHLVRLLAGRTNFRKIWLILRRVIAIAELIGLPRTVRSSRVMQDQSYPSNMTTEDHAQSAINSRESKAETWISICTLDRILGMMCNLPPGTARYPLPLVERSSEDPQRFLKHYLRSLADNASKIQELDDLRIAGGSDDEIHTEVLQVDRNLILLASTAPRGWWEDNHSPSDLALQLLPYWHYYITLRTHLLLTLQRDDKHRFDYSRFTCMNACRQVLLRFLKMRPLLTGGFFVGRLLDLQALTAAIVLLLSYHATKFDVGFHFQAQTIGEPIGLIMQVVGVMEETMKQKSSDFTKQAALTLRGLKSLLEDDGRFQAKDITLRVPLLGKIHVKKKIGSSGPPERPAMGPINADPAAQFQQLNDMSVPAPAPALSHTMSSGGNSSASYVNAWGFDPFTWVIEDDRESSFRDAILAEDFSQFESPINYDNFQFAT